MVKDYNKFLKLSQILNNSFGTTGPGGQIVNGFNVILKPITENAIKATAIMNVSFASDQMMREMIRKYREDAISMIKSSLERAKKEYDIKFNDNIKLDFDQNTFDESTEFYQINQYNSICRAFYRVTILAQVTYNAKKKNS